MKADSGSWFYIILSIIFLVISAFGKNKKKADVTTKRPDADYDTPSEPTQKWPRNLEEVLAEVLELPKQKEVVVPKEEKMEKKDIYAERYGKPAYETEAQSLEVIEEEAQSLEISPVVRKTDPVVVTKPSTIPLKESPRKIQEQEELVGSEFDLRQAIISAEILNRKYF